jgi:parvulin-like peptidyl-prolyl isomerase
VKARSVLIDRFVAVSIAFLFLAVAAPSHGVTVDKVIATVDKEPVTLSDYILFARSLGVETDKELVDERVLRKLIEEKVILCEARRRGIETGDSEADKMLGEARKEGALSVEEFETELAKEGMNLERYRRLMKDKITALKLVEVEVDSKVAVTDKEIENAYTANRNDYVATPAHVEVKAIFMKLGEGASATEITDLKRKAVRIASQLKEGDNFEAMVNRYSDEPLKSKRGMLGVFQRGALIPELDKKAFSMNAGDISDPLWVKEGVYILKLISRTDDGFKSMGEVREEIYKHLYAQHRERIYSDWMKVLWEKSSITIN